MRRRHGSGVAEMVRGVCAARGESDARGVQGALHMDSDEPSGDADRCRQAALPPFPASSSPRPPPFVRWGSLGFRLFSILFSPFLSSSSLFRLSRWFARVPEDVQGDRATRQPHARFLGATHGSFRASFHVHPT